MSVLLTKQLIAEQVLYRLAGGVYDRSFPIQPPDVYKAIEQKVNDLFKLKHFDTNLASGETIPENTMIATYENVAVSTYGGKSKSTLPVIPISLPKSMGIYLVYSDKYPDNPFIPIQRGQTALLRTDALLNDLFGMVSYEPKNKEIIYNRDLTTLGIDTVTMELCVFDISQYSATDTLPIPADYAEVIVKSLVEDFAPVMPESGYVNNFTNANQQINK